MARAVPDYIGYMYEACVDNADLHAAEEFGTIAVPLGGVIMYNVTYRPPGSPEGEFLGVGMGGPESPAPRDFYNVKREKIVLYPAKFARKIGGLTICPPEAQQDVTSVSQAAYLLRLVHGSHLYGDFLRKNPRFRR